MLIPKNKITETVTNPLRPKIGVRPEEPNCKLSWYSYEIEEGIVEKMIQVDTEHEVITEFCKFLKGIYDSDKEVWYLEPVFKTDAIDFVKKYHPNPTIELSNWE